MNNLRSLPTVTKNLLIMLGFYLNKKKIIPSHVLQNITPLSLAVWFMDDGTREGHQARLNSQSFTRRENEKLSDMLEAKLGILTTINRDKDLFRLRIRDQSMPLFRTLVGQYIIPSMQYKLSL